MHFDLDYEREFELRMRKAGSYNPAQLVIITSGDESHLCGASLRENHKIYHAHGIDYHHIGMGLVPQTTACSMSVSPRLIQLHA